jgi:hypothetical protein
MQGCYSAAKGPVFSGIKVPAPDTATLYLYRPSSDGVTAIIPEIKITPKESVSLKSGGYVAVALPPGKYKLEQQKSFHFPSATTIPYREYTITLQSGDITFIRQRVIHTRTNIHYNGVVTAQYAYELSEIPKEIGQEEIIFTRALQETK